MYSVPAITVTPIYNAPAPAVHIAEPVLRLGMAPLGGLAVPAGGLELRVEIAPLGEWPPVFQHRCVVLLLICGPASFVVRLIESLITTCFLWQRQVPDFLELEGPLALLSRYS